MRDNFSIFNTIHGEIIKPMRNTTSTVLSLICLLYFQYAVAQQLTTTTLPIVILNTNGQTIVDDPKIIADMGIIDNGPGQLNKPTDAWNNYNGKIGIEIRGSSSQMYPKKSYGFETRETADPDNDLKVSLLGMPSESDWILYAPYSDKSMIRDVFTYHLSRSMGWYAPRFRYCELILNGDYQGVYVLLEKIKRDGNRVNVTKLKPSDNTGDNVTGGYILKIDKTTGTVGGGFDSQYQPNIPAGKNKGQKITFLYEYPQQRTPAKSDDITPAQQQYIQTFINTFETSLKNSNFADATDGYRKYINTASFIDYFLLTETVFNVDGYRLSTFLYKDKDSKGGKLTMGPVWDYNISQGNADYYDGSRTDRWVYRMNYSFSDDYWLVPFWWERLLEDPLYRNDAKCRWNTLRQGVLKTESVTHFIDSLATMLQDAQARNYQRWPILNQYVWPNAKITGSYKGEIDYYKQWITDRLTWLDANMAGVCEVLASEKEVKTIRSALYPNPFTGEVSLRMENMPRNASLTTETYDLLGQKVNTHAFVWKNTSEVLPLQSLPPGIYLVKVIYKGQLLQTLKVIRQ